MEYINKRYLLDKRPIGMPNDDCWKLEEEKISSIEKNEILIFFSIFRFFDQRTSVFLQKHG